MHGTIDSSLRVEWRPLPELSLIAGEWRSLAERALFPNVFYEPAFALAAASALGRGVGAVLVWSCSGKPCLLGLFPARVERRRYGIALPVLVGWTHPFAPLGAPLIDQGLADAVIAAWLDHIVNDPGMPDTVLLPFLPIEGELAHAIAAALARCGGTSKPFAPHHRALLAPAGARATYLDAAIGRKRRKELNRLRRRLEAHGPLALESSGETWPLAQAIDAFFDLEAGGWKGRLGTAARSDPEIAQFMRSAIARLADEGKARIDSLRLDGRSIAATVTLRSGDTAWVWKIAYDERFARFSPGVQHMLDLTKALLDDPTLARVDSCATPDHPMIDHIWRERLGLADLLLTPKAGSSSRFSSLCHLEAARRAALGVVKRGRDVVRGRWARDPTAVAVGVTRAGGAAGG